MSPRMYSLLWVAVTVVAAILWIGGVFSLFVGVVFGFIAFGLVFMGMICVLPSTVSHPHQAVGGTSSIEMPERARAGIPTYRSA